MDDVREQRRRLRAAGRLARSRMTGRARDDATTAIVTRLLALPEIAAAGCVLVTAAIGDELDLAAIRTRLAVRGTTVLLPVVDGDDLVPVAWHEAIEVRRGWRDVPEPVGPATTATPDVVVVPGLVLDRAGGRLGYGGGHFDRYLAGPGAAAAAVGAVFDAQLVEAVPLLPHDVRLDVVVTELGAWREGQPVG